jgi:hypothetical protein
VFRNEYLTMRAGYRYQTSLTNHDSAIESRGILESSLPDTCFLGIW